MGHTSDISKPRSTDSNRLPTARQSGSVYAQLREELRSSVLQAGQPGDRVPSERQLAQQFGVSPITISRALQELQTEGAIERIVGKGTFISKTAPLEEPEGNNATAASSSASSVSGAWDWQAPLADTNANAVLPHVWILASLGSLRNEPSSSEFWSHRLTSHVERFVQKVGGRTVVTDLEAIAPDDIEATIGRMESAGVNSIVFLDDVPHAATPLWGHRFLSMQSGKSGRRLAVTQVSFGNTSRFPLDTVRFDGEQGIFLAVSHLLELGHREIAFLSPALDTPWVGDRIRGFQRALQMADQGQPHGTSPEKDERIFHAAPFQDYSHQWAQAGREAGEKLLNANRFSAVVVANDAMAKAFIELARERGLSVPEDVSVIGFDDWHYSSPLGLTTLHPPIEAMGEVAASLALKRLRQPFEQGRVEVVLTPTLVVRSSTQTL